MLVVLMSTSCLPANQLFRRFLLSAALLLCVAQAHAGLVLHYKFDETTGTTAADSSGSGYTGTLTNMTGSEWTTGKVGGALSFDGSNDRISVPIAAPWTERLPLARQCGLIWMPLGFLATSIGFPLPTLPTTTMSCL